MSDPIAQAFAHLPHPEPAADFDRRVLARLAPSCAAETRAARAVMIGYWLGALAASAIGLAEMPAMSAAEAMRGGATVLVVVLCSLVAAGGARNWARAVRSTLR